MAARTVAAHAICEFPMPDETAGHGARLLRGGSYLDRRISKKADPFAIVQRISVPRSPEQRFRDGQKKATD
jgi:hypothetical protein